MSNTYCRFCEVTIKGLYLNCPKCGKWLAPSDGDDIEPEEYELATPLQEERYHGCSCHINPPCSHCVECDECNEE